MKLKISEDADVNYLASVIKIVDIKDHPNADRLSLTEVFGNTVILAKGSYEIGEVCVYFPVESCLHPKFLSWANLYDKPELNSDGKTKGFFSNKGNRVKAVKLREIPSQGFLFKVSELAKYYGVSPNIFSVGESFNVVGEDLLVTKYIRPDRSDRSVQNQASTKNKIPNWVNSILGFLPRPIRTVLFKPVKWYFGLSKDDGIKSLIVDGQFKFHYKTEHLGKNIWLIKPHDYITITSKLHGTSAIFSNILCKKPLSIFQSMRKYMGFDVVEFEYKEVYSSRSVLKNRRDNKHTDDVWGKHMAELSGKISPGISMYGEIVGYSSPNKCIQKNYDYGCPSGESSFKVYRVTETTWDNRVKEYSWNEIEDLCKSIGIDTVPRYYNGLAKDIFQNLEINENWSDNWLNELKNTYLDKTCEFCKSGVVNEGIVVKIDSSENKTVFKFKSPAFLVKESSDRDAGEEDLEEIS